MPTLLKLLHKVEIEKKRSVKLTLQEYIYPIAKSHKDLQKRGNY